MLFVIYILFSIHLQLNWIHHLNKHTAHDKMCGLYILEPFYTVMYYEFLLSLFDFVIIQIHVFLKQSLETPYVMMLEYVLQIQLSGERTLKLL